ncbi:MAG: GAF domain-containing protein [Chloroflexota bacterium]|nr:GAF domain-containing protein [Chloroflexota bacterium]MDE3194588.1 GAF domain-containing protein [Chloroflexota bacterium]
MTAVTLVQLLSQAIWVVLGVAALARWLSRRTWTDRDIALFFGAIAVVTIEGRLAQVTPVPAQVGVGVLVVIMALPYVSIRLAHDFAGVPTWIRRGNDIGFLLAAVVVVVAGTTRVTGTLYLVVYFVGATAYSALRFTTAGAHAYGVTRRRMRLIASGSYLLALAILLAGLGLAEPTLVDATNVLTQACALVSAVSYALGLVPPSPLKRYWQLTELSAFLSRASVLPRATMREIVDEVAALAARALGARATIGVWSESEGVLRFHDPHGALPEQMGASDFLAWRAFSTQTSMYIPDVARENPSNAAKYRASNVGPVLIAPIVAGERRLGVIEVYAARQPIFAEDDLAFVELVAQQAAVVLESRQLIDEAARVRAQEEAAVLKEDFVSAAAHDLKTPLTTIFAQAQLLERRAEREGRTSELTGLRRLLRETSQLARLVEELLDASRLERGALPMQPEECDLASLAREVAESERSGADRIELEADGPVRGVFDRDRVRQLIDNLVENGLKYSPRDSRVRLRVWQSDGQARIAVTDRGIGIPSEDVPHVFDRFRRGSNVDHRRSPGIGLGLYICRGIVEQHGGRIWVETAPGRGATFQVALPLGRAGERPAVDASSAAS